MLPAIDAPDVVAIEQLLHAIAAAADTATDLDDYLTLLTADAVFEFAAVPAIGLAAHIYRGTDELRAGVIERRSAGVQGPGTRTLHIVSDITVLETDGVTALVHAAWQYLGIRDGAPAILSMGLYRNTVRNVDGTWLLARREVTVL